MATQGTLRHVPPWGGGGSGTPKNKQFCPHLTSRPPTQSSEEPDTIPGLAASHKEPSNSSPAEGKQEVRPAALTAD